MWKKAKSEKGFNCKSCTKYQPSDEFLEPLSVKYDITEYEAFDRAIDLSPDEPGQEAMVDEETEEKIVVLKKQGKKAKEIVRATGLNLETVQKILANKGFRLRSVSVVTKPMREKIARLYKTGRSCSDIAKELGLSASTINVYISRIKGRKK